MICQTCFSRPAMDRCDCCETCWYSGRRLPPGAFHCTPCDEVHYPGEPCPYWDSDGEDYTNRDFDHEAAIDQDFYSGEGF